MTMKHTLFLPHYCSHRRLLRVQRRNPCMWTQIYSECDNLLVIPPPAREIKIPISYQYSAYRKGGETENTK